LCWFVVRDIRRPHLDPVRADGLEDDPAGGVLDGAPDAFRLQPPGRGAPPADHDHAGIVQEDATTRA
jgi:hypothetical protein